VLIVPEFSELLVAVLVRVSMPAAPHTLVPEAMTEVMLEATTGTPLLTELMTACWLRDCMGIRVGTNRGGGATVLPLAVVGWDITVSLN